jgi:mannose/fructose-specific phosphotransferase system component IIA
MIRALVVTHGRLGEELCQAVELFLGPVAELDALSNAGLSGPQLAESVERWLRGGAESTAAPAAPAIILVDEFGGSCTTAARMAAAGRGDVRIVCGVNLAMLLGFVSWRESLELPALTRRLINAGREAIVEAGIEP